LVDRRRAASNLLMVPVRSSLDSGCCKVQRCLGSSGSTIDVSSVVASALTTVAIDRQRLGREAVARPMQTSVRSDERHDVSMLPADLVVRERT
jgi:hypothetical protein